MEAVISGVAELREEPRTEFIVPENKNIPWHGSVPSSDSSYGVRSAALSELRCVQRPVSMMPQATKGRVDERQRRGPKFRPRGFKSWHAQHWLQGARGAPLLQRLSPWLITGLQQPAMAATKRLLRSDRKRGLPSSRLRSMCTADHRGHARARLRADRPDRFHQWPWGRTGSGRDRLIRTNAVHREGSETLHGFAGP